MIDVGDGLGLHGALFPGHGLMEAQHRWSEADLAQELRRQIQNRTHHGLPVSLFCEKPVVLEGEGDKTVTAGNNTLAQQQQGRRSRSG